MAIRDATVVVVVAIPFTIRAFIVGRERQLKKMNHGAVVEYWRL
jgi:hypothetical protein